MLQTCVRSVALFLVLLFSIGCSRDGVLEDPDSGITITTPEAIHGAVGHLVEFTIGDKAAPVTDQVVVQLEDHDIANTVLYLSLAHTSGHTGNLAELIALLKRAGSVSLVSSLPRGIQQAGGVILSFGDEQDPPFLTYLRIATVDGTVYWSVRGTLSSDRRDWFLTEVRKLPKVIDTRPPRVVEINYYRDTLFTQPLVDEVYIGETIYTKVVFSKDIPITLANDSRARPRITSVSPTQSLQYHMKPRGTVLQSGEAAPFGDSSRIFIAAYRVATRDLRGDFSVTAGSPAVSGPTLQAMFYRYTADDIPSNTGVTITDWHPTDFVGQVFTVRPDSRRIDRSLSTPLPGVIVTIMSGPRSGERTVTDRNGRYLFSNVSGDSLHLGTDRLHYEPKEVLVYRSAPTTLADGSDPNYWMDPQEQPGNILIGHRWPDEVRFLFEETLLPYDLLYIEYDTTTRAAAGSYGDGFVVLYNRSMPNPLNSLPTFAHEFAHAHQHAIASIDGSAGVLVRSPLWRASPEGRAYAAARAKDWAEVGEIAYDRNPYFRDRLRDSAAEVCAYYWGETRWEVRLAHIRENLKEAAPNRYRWAAEWLPKK